MTMMMTVAQASRHLGVSQENVLRLAERGHVAVVDGMMRVADVNRMQVAIQIARKNMSEST